MTKTLRPFQATAVANACAFVCEVADHDEWTGKQRRRLFAAPTGSGKTLCELEILKWAVGAGLDAWIVTPSLEIVRGMLSQVGVDTLPTDDEKLADLAETHKISTPTRLRNRCLDGRKAVPDLWIVDEVHHAIEQNEVSGCNFSMAPASAWIGFTATDYRGTPAGTAALREAWGEPVRLLTYPQAIEHGFVALPKVEVIPLLDDDTCKIVNGEFQEKSTSKAVVDKIGALAAILARWWSPQRGGSGPGEMDTPTCVSVPSDDAVGSLVSALDALGVDSVPVTQATKPADRVAAFELCRQRRAVLVQIKVVSEGVDLPWLGRIVDARPLVSPVAWLQWFGRVTRPYPHVTKHYVCTNRNLERHAYLLQGALPRSAVAQAQAAFLGPSKRGAGRIVGLESLGRLKAIELPLAGGVQSSAYMVYSVDEKGVKHEWSVLLDPCHERPITAYRCLHPTGDAEKPWDYKGDGAKWTLREMPSDFSGYATSAARGSLTDKQANWWKRAAHRYGLDSEATVTMRQFAALPVLKDLGLSLAAQPVAGEA